MPGQLVVFKKPNTGQLVVRPTKRRRKGKVARYTPKLRVNRQLKGAFPPILDNVMHFSSGAQTTGSIIQFSKGFWANKIDDPSVLGSISPPRMYDIMKGIYEVYRVKAVKVTLVIENSEPIATAHSAMAYIGFVPNTYLIPSSDIEVMQKPRLFRTRLLNRNTGMTRMSWYTTISKMQNQRQSVVSIDDNYHGNIDGNGPAVTPQIYVGAFVNDQITNQTFFYRVYIAYYTQWSRMHDV